MRISIGKITAKGRLSPVYDVTKRHITFIMEGNMTQGNPPVQVELTIKEAWALLNRLEGVLHGES